MCSLLNKFGFRLVFYADKLVLSKSGMFVGKGYLCNDMFKLNVLAITNNKNNVIFVYLVKSFFSLCHNRLSHVNCKRMHEMMKFDLLSCCDKNEEKCNTCMLTKVTRSPFLKIERTSKMLDLIYSDVSDLHGTPTLGGNKYFVTFIDDFLRYLLYLFVTFKR